MSWPGGWPVWLYGRSAALPLTQEPPYAPTTARPPPHRAPQRATLAGRSGCRGPGGWGSLPDQACPLGAARGRSGAVGCLRGTYAAPHRQSSPHVHCSVRRLPCGQPGSASRCARREAVSPVSSHVNSQVCMFHQGVGPIFWRGSVPPSVSVNWSRSRSAMAMAMLFCVTVKWRRGT